MVETASQLMQGVPPAFLAICRGWSLAKQIFIVLPRTVDLETDEVLEDCLKLIDFLPKKGSSQTNGYRQGDAPPIGRTLRQPSGEEISMLAAAVGSVNQENDQAQGGISQRLRKGQDELGELQACLSKAQLALQLHLDQAIGHLDSLSHFDLRLCLHSLKTSMGVESAPSAKTYLKKALESSVRAFSAAHTLQCKIVATVVATVVAYAFMLLEKGSNDLTSAGEAKVAAQIHLRALEIDPLLTSAVKSDLHMNGGDWRSIKALVDVSKVYAAFNSLAPIHTAHLKVPINGVHLRTLQAHERSVTALALGRGGVLYSGGRGGDIKKWDFVTGECLGTSKAHHGPVDSLVVHDTVVYSGSRDNTIKLLDAETLELVTTLRGHTDDVEELVIGNCQLFSSSVDGTVREWWSSKHGVWRCRSLEAHAGGVGALAIGQGGLFTGGGPKDPTIKVWRKGGSHPTGWQCVATLHGHRDQVNSLVVGHSLLFSASFDSTVMVWQLTEVPDVYSQQATSERWECVANLQGGEDVVWELALGGDGLLYAASGMVVKVWSTDTWECVRTLQGHTADICCLALGDRVLFSGSKDHTARAWLVSSAPASTTESEQLCR